MKNNQNITKWMNFAAVLMYAAAVFQFADGKILLGAVFFGAAVCFTCAAGKYQKKEPNKNGRKIEQGLEQ